MKDRAWNDEGFDQRSGSIKDRFRCSVCRRRPGIIHTTVVGQGRLVFVCSKPCEAVALLRN